MSERPQPTTARVGDEAAQHLTPQQMYLALWDISVSLELYRERIGRETLGLSHQEMVLLCYLTTIGPSRPTTLSRRMSLPASSLGSLVSRLLKRGLVERLPDPNDRRGRLIGITDQGEHLILKIRDEFIRVVAEAMRNQSEAENTHIWMFLLTVSWGVERLPALRPEDFV